MSIRFSKKKESEATKAISERLNQGGGLPFRLRQEGGFFDVCFPHKIDFKNKPTIGLLSAKSTTILDYLEAAFDTGLNVRQRQQKDENDGAICHGRKRDGIGTPRPFLSNRTAFMLWVT